MKLYSIRPGFKDARIKAKLTQQQVADSLVPPVSLKTVMNWEQGIVAPSLETVIKIADLLHCDIDFLTGRINAKTHDIQFIQDKTGLSEETITLLMQWKNSDDRSRFWPGMISNIIDDPEYDDFMSHLSYYLGSAIFDAISQVRRDKDLNADELKIASLWYLTHAHGNILERMYKNCLSLELKKHDSGRRDNSDN